MKKLLMTLAIALTTVLGLSAKTDWSKVKLTHANTCNVYKFEIAGTVDSCFDYRYVEIADFNAKVISRTYTRTFTVTFPDTGTYYWASSVKNKCGKDDTTMYGTIKVTCMPKKCDWSKVTLKSWSQNNYFKYQLNGVDRDSCTDYLFTIIDRQTKKVDTVFDRNGYVEIQFNKKGKYVLRIPIYNKCTGCDTVIYREINIRYFTGATTSLKGKDDDCDVVVFEMTNMKDTCIEYYYYYYSGTYFDTMSTKHWNDLTDSEIYRNYQYPDSDLVDYGPTERVWKDTFSKKGRYLLIAQFYDKCLNQDTFMFRKFTTCDSTTVGIKNIVKVEPKLIAMYDMLGRPVHQARENEIVIYLFSDGTTRKVVKK